MCLFDVIDAVPLFAHSTRAAMVLMMVVRGSLESAVL